ncbi:MAG: hypothetical protein Q8M24_10445 [Pseudolabrys sp.]|nr:hypothetical protein [Pseudolabrys sp.]MDP2295867.1 hypothetical protein [Pseudolabrys sp.]
MQYQDCAIEVQADEMEAAAQAGLADLFAPKLAGANINPQTGLATDYLNHFNEAIMLLEMVGSCPECLTDFSRWQPMSYREHFIESHFKGRDLAIAAYAGADPAARACLDYLATTMTTVIETTRVSIAGLPAPAASELAGRAAAWLKPLVARAGAVINGEIDLSQIDAPQTIADRLMRRA